MRIRYYIDPATGLPHIYEHGISESDVEEIFDNPRQDCVDRTAVNKNKNPRGWTEARIRKVIKYYDSQTEDDEAVEIESALATTTMEVPKALVPVVRDLISTRKSTRVKKRALKSRTSANRSRAA